MRIRHIVQTSATSLSQLSLSLLYAPSHSSVLLGLETHNNYYRSSVIVWKGLGHTRPVAGRTGPQDNTCLDTNYWILPPHQENPFRVNGRDHALLQPSTPG
jgi:hypothetical protein